MLTFLSCAAPTFAAIISNLNCIRMSVGKPALGFLNPWLYSEGYMALNDIVDGGAYHLIICNSPGGPLAGEKS